MAEGMDSTVGFMLLEVCLLDDSLVFCNTKMIRTKSLADSIGTALEEVVFFSLPP